MPAPFLGELDKLNPAFTWKKHKLKYLDDFWRRKKNNWGNKLHY
jgi:hypothetical protein